MTFIKLCGFRDRSTLDVALALDVDAIGFVFAKSPRQITVDAARPLVELTSGRAEPVGVFKGSSIAEVIETASTVGLKIVQVHDLLEADDVARLHGAGLAVYRAVAAGSDYTPVGEEELLIDGSTAGAGETWEWDLLDGPTRPWILAGGLGVDNVREGLAATGAFGVDVSSGIESSRGVKDALLIERFVTEVRR